jgi:diaminohydroxyphosphoribosylaminopyrimidine deaminase/5-amino-6-(5-phosphoribosylamino)uracil reductase
MSTQDFRSQDEFYMQYAVSLAERGRGFVSPNPLVGAVVVKNNEVIGEGYHQYFGGPHAEVNALRNIKKTPQGATMYVTLEPCAFLSKKTPPCVPQLIAAGLRRVVIGSPDPNPKNRYRGIKALKEAGIEVTVGILEEIVKKQNASYFKFIRKGIPYVSLKLGLTLDGKMADQKGFSKWITSPISRDYVQLLRKNADAVLIGIGTVLKDNPRLTCRIAPQKKLIKVILDSNLRTPKNAQLFKKASNIIIFTNKTKMAFTKKLPAEIIQVKKTGEELDWEEILKKLGQRNIASLLIEGGAKVASSALRNGIVDKLYLFYAPKILGSGLGFSDYLKTGGLSDALELKEYSITRCGEDFLIQGLLDK